MQEAFSSDSSVQVILKELAQAADLCVPGVKTSVAFLTQGESPPPRALLFDLEGTPACLDAKCDRELHFSEIAVLRALIDRAVLTCQKARVEKRGVLDQERLKLLETTVRDMQEAVIITDNSPGADGLKIVFMNEAAIRLTGYPAEELIGESIALLQGPKTDRKVIQKMLDAMQRGESITVETVNYRKDEADFVCNWSLSPIYGEEGKISHWVSVRRDVSELRRAEEEQLHTSKLRAVGELAGGIAHEFKNLLTPMLLHIQTVADELQGKEDLLSELKVASEAIVKARDLSERVLMLGKKSPMQNEWHSLRGLIEENLKLATKTIDRRIDLVTRFEPDLPVVWLCRFSFSQIMLNLLFNARDTLLEKIAEGTPSAWIPRMGIVLERVAAVPPASMGLGTRKIPCQRFAVEDNGKGIPIHVRDRMFEPFFTTKTSSQGTGLGLSLVWNLVHSMGGWIQVQSVPSIGTRMLVLFPEAAQVMPEAVEKIPVEPSVSWHGKGLRALLVEDEPIVARALMLQMKKMGFEVSLATDGREGMEMVQAQPQDWDIIISDLNMPQMDGADFIHHLRKTTYAGKVLVVSGYISEEDRQRLNDACVDEIVSKPISREELTRCLNRLLV